MNYFGKKISIGRLEVDPDALNSDSPALQSRFDRISENYSKLDLVLTDLENKITNNDHLKAKQAQEQAARLAAEQAALVEQNGSPAETDESIVNPGQPRQMAF